MQNMTCKFSPEYFPSSVKGMAVEILVLVLNIFNLICGTVANSLVIFLFYRNSRLRTIQNRIFMYLAITDICVAALVQPIYVATIVNSLLGKHVCPLWDARVILSKFFLGLSLITITILSLQTYITLAYPYLWQRIITKFRLNITLISSWIFILFLTAAVFLHEGFFFYAMPCIVFITIATVMITWCWTCKLVARHRRAIQTTQRPSNSENIPQKKILRSTITGLVVIFSLLVCYVLALLHFVFADFLYSSRLDHLTNHILWSISVTLMYLNSLLNPCLVFWRSTPFREALKNIFNLKS